MMSDKTRGFGSMPKEKQREIASLGGKKAQELGTAHKFTEETARAAGKKGGLARKKQRQEQAEQPACGGACSADHQ